MARRQLHELMLCGGAAEHQLALISDTTEIADTYPAFLHEEQPDNNNNQRKKKNTFICKSFLLKMEESPSQKQVL